MKSSGKNDIFLKISRIGARQLLSFLRSFEIRIIYHKKIKIHTCSWIAESPGLSKVTFSIMGFPFCIKKNILISDYTRPLDIFVANVSISHLLKVANVSISHLLKTPENVFRRCKMGTMVTNGLRKNVFTILVLPYSTNNFDKRNWSR